MSSDPTTIVIAINTSIDVQLSFNSTYFFEFSVQVTNNFSVLTQMMHHSPAGKNYII